MRRELLRFEGVSGQRGEHSGLNCCRVNVFAGEVCTIMGLHDAGQREILSFFLGRPFSRGRVYFEEERLQSGGVRDFQKVGIYCVLEESSLISSLSLPENIFLFRDAPERMIIRKRAMNRQAAQILDEAGPRADLRTPVSMLSEAERIQVELARDTIKGAKLILLDEAAVPRAASEKKLVLELIKYYSGRGIAFLIFSYNTDMMSDVLEISDRIHIMRGGSVARTFYRGEYDKTLILGHILGRPELCEAKSMVRAAERPENERMPALEVQDFRLSGTDGLSFSVFKGEVFGLFDISGVRGQELVRALRGFAPDYRGVVTVDGRETPIKDVAASVGAGIACPVDSDFENRLQTALTAAENLSFQFLRRSGRCVFLRTGPPRLIFNEYIRELAFENSGPDAHISALSTDERLRLCCWQWLIAGASVMLFNKCGVVFDSRHNKTVRELVCACARRGAGVLLFSGDYDELLSVCDRILTV